MKAPPTPNLDKMIDVRERSQSIGDFITWLKDKGWRIVVINAIDEDQELEIVEIADEMREGRMIKLMGEFFGIDTVEAERERMRLLVWVQEMNEQGRLE